MGETVVSLGQFVLLTVELMAVLFIFVIGSVILWVAIAYIIDIRQTAHAIRRNYPVIGRFRYLFEHLGEFFRQYFFAMDRQELPFNRAQRSWVYRAAKNVDSTVAFGYTDNLNEVGKVLFVNCAFPTLGQDAVPVKFITIGFDCRYLYTTSVMFNISGMSYGALSKPAI
jgi:glutamate synthase domain-containing protein 2